MSKRCSKCKRDLPELAFCMRNGVLNGQCRDCANANSHRYKSNKRQSLMKFCPPDATDAAPVADASASLRALSFAAEWRWHVSCCPFCGKQHSHAAGRTESGVRSALTVRLSHCENNKQPYLLVEKGTDQWIHRRLID